MVTSVKFKLDLSNSIIAEPLPNTRAAIENLVTTETVAMLMDDDMIEAIVSMLMRIQDEETSDLPICEKQLRETEAAIDNIVTAIANAMHKFQTNTDRL